LFQQRNGGTRVEKTLKTGFWQNRPGCKNQMVFLENLSLYSKNGLSLGVSDLSNDFLCFSTVMFLQIPVHMEAPNCAKHSPQTTVPVLLHEQTLMIVPDEACRVRVHGSLSGGGMPTRRTDTGSATAHASALFLHGPEPPGAVVQPRHAQRGQGCRASG
jgi:hypothetical protein